MRYKQAKSVIVSELELNELLILQFSDFRYTLAMEGCSLQCLLDCYARRRGGSPAFANRK